MKLISFVLTSLFAFSPLCLASDFNELNKDIKILKRILETSLSESSETRGHPRIEAFYLANQGMVFTITSGGGLVFQRFDGDWDAWGESVGQGALSLVQSIVPAIEPLAPEAAKEIEAELADELFHFEIDNSEQRNQLKNELGKLRDQLREHKEFYGDNLRELREIERESYRADESRKKELEDRKKVIEKHVEENKKRMKAYSDKMNEYRKERDKKTQLKKQSMISLSAATLCNYSASLRNLEDSEHVSLIFENFADDTRNSDEIIVFKKSALKDCKTDDKGIERLLAKATRYQQ